MKKIIFVFVLLAAGFLQATAQNNATDSIIVKPKKKWYETIAIRGYSQIRYNRLFETNSALKCEQCDKSWGDNGGIFIRRARVILFGNVHERVYIYIQPDLASASGTTLNYGQLRDLYFDLSLDKKKEFRLRIGQSKVPYGFENLQSSQNRLALDRNDALNSAVANERDIAAFFYWAPSHIRERFSWLVNSGLKGSGDYGVFGFGVYNGQTANRPEMNNQLHVVSRISYPFKLNNGQIFEPGLQAFSGYANVKEVRSAGVGGADDILEQRAAASFVWYPQPLGFQAEYTFGKGPEYNKVTNSIDRQPLEGGYAQIMYMFKIGEMLIIPFVRSQHYMGGKKHEKDARSYRVFDNEIGVEWQPFPNFELVAIYTISDRTFEDSARPDNRQTGRLLRLQLQFNY